MESPYLGQCYLCGRQLRSRKWEVHVHGGGSFILTKEESRTGSHGFEDGEDLGLQPIGSECIKDIPAECRFKAGECV
jgi:hypothetical protein